MNQVITERMVPVACDLVDRVRDQSPQAVQELIHSLNPQERYALTVVLAAMVPTDRTVTELLAWIDGPATVYVPRVALLRPCGTHAAYVRHKKRDERPCEACVEAERGYQRERKRERRRAA